MNAIFRKLFLLWFLLIFWTACAAPESSTPTAVSLITLVPTRQTATPPATATAVPPAATATSTPSPTATRIIWPPDPTFTPIPTRTPLPTHYELPDWINDPDAVVLMAFLRIEFRSEKVISFINITTNEQFNLSAPPHASYLAWGQDEQGLYFEFDHNQTIGNVISDLYIQRIYVETGNSIQVQPGNTGIVKSPNGRFVARIIREDELLTVTIEDQETGSVISLNDPFSGHYPDHTKIEWSPEGEFLAVLRYQFGDPLHTGLSIYTPDGAIYRQYEDKKGHFWAPDNSYRILYLQGEFENALPCIVEIQENSNFCLEEIAGWREEEGVKTYYYQWLPDGNHISFVYWGAWGAGLTGFCNIEIESRDINCPFDVETFGGQDEAGGINYIVEYPTWSPDDHYLWLIVDHSPPESDDRGLSRIATIASDGSEFKIWGYGYDYISRWRPAITP